MTSGTRRRSSSWILLPLLIGAGCGTPASHYRDADRAAYGIIEQKQRQGLGRSQRFTVEPSEATLRRRLLQAGGLPHSGPASLGSRELARPGGWPQLDDGGEPVAPPSPAPASPLTLSLSDALQVAARNSREYQAQKEAVFRSALALDLERDEFRNSFAGLISGGAVSDGGPDPSLTGVEGGADLSLSRRFKTGASFAASVALDLVKLLSGGGDSALGLLADASVTVPLLRGAGRAVVTEPLTQAEQEVLYAVWAFERFKRVFAVDVITEYLEVLREQDRVRNAEVNYRGLIASTRRARRLADSGRLPEIQVDQVVQDALRARSRWIQVQENHQRQLDRFKLTLGLPTDAELELDRAELEALTEILRRSRLDAAAEAGAPPPADAPDPAPPAYREGAPDPPLDEARAVRVALQRRLDLSIGLGRVEDAQRKVTVAADALRAGLEMVASAQAGGQRSLASAPLDDAGVELDTGRYAVLLSLDLPWERTAERNAFRESFVTLESAVRSLQEAEDQVKFQVRDGLRQLAEAREGIGIQGQATALAERRVRSTDLFLQAGRAEIRDLLEAREALLGARNALTEATIAYRVAELGLQRDLGVLEIDESGVWGEVDLYRELGADPRGEDGSEE
jgi:outer membrane protein TolC